MSISPRNGADATLRQRGWHGFAGGLRGGLAQPESRPAPTGWDALGRMPVGSYLARMGNASGDSVTRWLERWREGDPAALDRLLPLVHADLRRIAAGMLRTTPGHATLQTTALINEMVLRLLGRETGAFESSAHLLNAAARMMRQVLVDRARRTSTDKRGGTWQRVEFAEVMDLKIPDGTDLVALDQALAELEAMDARMAKVVELRFFIGMNVSEVAATLGVVDRTAQRDWIAAREWLRRRLGEGCD